MFVLARNHLKAVANLIGVVDVRFTRGTAQGSREIRIFSMPSRGVLSQDFSKQNENARQGIVDYIDPNDRNPARTTGVSITDVTGNSGATVKATGALFVTNGVLFDDYFHRDDTGKRSKIVSVDDEDTLTLTDAGITGDKLNFHVSPKTGHQIVKRRVVKAIQKISFVVQFNGHNIDIAEKDFLNFARNVGKFIYDGQFAEYFDEASKVDKIDSKGNAIKINLGPYEFLDNKFYGEYQNSIVQEVEFVGGVYIVPDNSTKLLEFPASSVAPNTVIKP